MEHQQNEKLIAIDNNQKSKSARIFRLFILMILLVVMILSTTGCMPGDGTNTVSNKAGFFSGVWHGWIAPVSLIYSLFNKNISIYETNNIGWLYNFGYYIAVISGFGGFAFSRKRQSGRQNRSSDG